MKAKVLAILMCFITINVMGQGTIKRHNTASNASKTHSIKSKSSTGTVNGHEWVDLGLSVKWATCNIGASLPCKLGEKYSWGEVHTKDSYTKENYKGPKYLSILDSSHDAATHKWGTPWRMPTAKELSELRNRCTWEGTYINGVKGVKITGKNGKSIFLPYDSDLYWSKTTDAEDKNYAYNLYFVGPYCGPSTEQKYVGLHIRAVVK